MVGRELDWMILVIFSDISKSVILCCSLPPELFGQFQVSTYGSVCDAGDEEKRFSSGPTVGGIQIRIKT